jgi:PAS domain S-box-containing protein
MIIPFLLLVLAGLYFKFRSFKKQFLLKNDQLNRKLDENKQALKNLKSSEKMLESMFNAVEDVVIFHDIDLKVLKANKAAGEPAGMTPNNLKGEKCFEVWMENQFEVCPDCPVQRALESKKPQTGTVQSADGNFWKTRAFPIFSKNGEVTSILEISRNITAQVTIEQQLEEYRLLVDASDDIIISMDTNMVCTVVNEAFLRYWQKQRSDVVGCNIADIIGTDLYEKNLKPSIIKAMQDERISYETWVTYPAIGKRFMNFHYVPIKNKANDKIIGVGGAVRDLTREYNLRHEQAQLSMAINQVG